MKLLKAAVALALASAVSAPVLADTNVALNGGVSISGGGFFDYSA